MSHEPWFDAALPDPAPTPLVISIPHAGTTVGAAFADALEPSLDVRCDADLFVDDLYDGLTHGALLVARPSRFVCDLNRDPNDVSATAVPEHPRPANSNGRGFVWEKTTDGVPVLRRSLSEREWEARRAIHTAYYAAIATALDRCRQRFGFAILLDAHSMPSVGRSGHTDPGVDRPQVCPGDRDGTSCSQQLTALVSEHFAGSGYTVRCNDPYKGGHITTHHGRPANGIHAIQLELRRDLYMHESIYRIDAAGFQRLRQTLATLVTKLEAFIP